MQKIPFAKLSPSGNPTILLAAQDVAPQERAAVSSALMQPLHLHAEQVGFVNMRALPPQLEMMGGEFCLNATRCLVYEMFRQKLFFPLAETDDLFGLVRSSGVAEPLHVRVKLGKSSVSDAPAECFVTVRAELAAGTLQQVGNGFLLARVPGITHLLVDEALHPCPPNPLPRAREYMERHGLLEEPACGVIWHKAVPEPASFTPPPGFFMSCAITPVVHVAQTGTLVQESACGSGTLALALAQAGRGGLVFMSVMQPSGDFLRVRMEAPAQGAGNCKVEVGGFVRLVAQGDVYL